MQAKEDKIRERAHAIWERDGRPSGRDREHWEQAAREIEAETAGGKPAATTKPARIGTKATKPESESNGAKGADGGSAPVKSGMGMPERGPASFADAGKAKTPSATTKPARSGGKPGAPGKA